MPTAPSGFQVTWRRRRPVRDSREAAGQRIERLVRTDLNCSFHGERNSVSVASIDGVDNCGIGDIGGFGPRFNFDFHINPKLVNESFEGRGHRGGNLGAFWHNSHFTSSMSCLVPSPPATRAAEVREAPAVRVDVPGGGFRQLETRI